jgi:chromosome partitioning protein
MIVSILNQKGGVGKTTIAVNLASAFKSMGYKVLLVDSDPQGSARDWHAQNGGETLDVIGLDRPTLDKDIMRFKKQYDVIFVDGAPGLPNMATRAILCSDVVLIPVQPSPYDVWSTSDLVGLLRQRQEIAEGKPRAAFIISRKIVNTILGREVRAVLEEYQLPVLANGTSQRVVYPSNDAEGKTALDSDCEAKREILALAAEVRELIGLEEINKTAAEGEECIHGVPKIWECSECIGCKCKCHLPEPDFKKLNANYFGLCFNCRDYHNREPGK